MRIGLISADFAPNVGGVAAHVVELGKALADAGHEVHVITLPLGDRREPVANWQGMQVHRPRIPRAKPFYSWLLHRWLKAFLRRTPLDILHVHGLRPLEATRGLTPPVIFTNHTSGYLKRIKKGAREHQRLARRLSHVCHILAPSEELAEASRLVGYAGPVDFISNGVDTTRFTPGAGKLRDAWGVGPEEVVVLLARRLVDKNGVCVFAEASGRLKGLPARLVFAGDGPERAKVETILSKLGMLERAVFLGNVDNGLMPDIYRSADLSVLPSFMEATSITGLESMACGLPLVGTRVGGIPVLIYDGETGLLVPPGDAPALGEAMATLIQAPELRERMGMAARQRADTYFSWRQIAAQTLGIYQQHVGGQA